MPMSPTEQLTYEAARKQREVEHADWRAEEARQDAQRERDKVEARRAYLAGLAEKQRTEEAVRQAARDRAAEAAIATYRTHAQLAFPGTAAQFDAAWPALLQQWQIDQTRDATAQLHAELRASGRYDGF